MSFRAQSRNLFLVILSIVEESAPCHSERSRGILILKMNYYIYIITNWNNKVMYIGVTNDLARRIYEHKHKLVDGFTKKYNVSKLVYFEHTTDVYSAITREKQLKNWSREKKNWLVEQHNPDWNEIEL